MQRTLVTTMTGVCWSSPILGVVLPACFCKPAWKPLHFSCLRYSFCDICLSLLHSTIKLGLIYCVINKSRDYGGYFTIGLVSGPVRNHSGRHTHGGARSHGLTATSPKQDRWCTVQVKMSSPYTHLEAAIRVPTTTTAGDQTGHCMDRSKSRRRGGWSDLGPVLGSFFSWKLFGSSSQGSRLQPAYRARGPREGVLGQAW
ncbi:hypothetical protein B0T17DRAFT_394319 [Bombardia bombarda]|uniref:Uncharacterized protein n=1 Tax=Bombardia bombarda TaxID=252184 RepID=A0AA39W511_9PEZI|nr:hypothetical protein B0T17DRAFT_394319 [Bombardia bombarda]